MVVIMALRDNTYEKFSPLLMEALFDTILEEINILRAEAGLPERPKEQFLGSTNNNLNHLDDYDWMDGT